MADRFEKILDLVPHFGRNNAHFPNSRYFWRSDQEILLVRPVPSEISSLPDDPGEKVDIWNTNSPVEVPIHWELLSVDLGGKTPSDFSKFNQDNKDLRKCLRGVLPFSDRSRKEIFPLTSMDISPCRCWLTWTIRKSLSSRTARWAVAPIDGRKHYASSEADMIGSQVPFLRDGKTWVVLEYGLGSKGQLNMQRAILRNTDDPDTEKPIDLPEVPDSNFLGLTAKGSLLLEDLSSRPFAGPPVKPAKFWQIPLEPPERANATSFAVEAPEKHIISEVMISPDGANLAWILLTDDWNQVELWISDIVGSDFQQISLLNKPREHGSAGFQFELPARPCGLKWTPSGKRVSYVFQNAIWSVTL